MSSASLKAIQARSQEEAQTILDSSVDTLKEWQTTYDEYFGSNIASITDTYSQESNLEANASLLTCLTVVRAALCKALTDLQSMETYIHLLMPQMEDGNNFGVTVQLTVLKTIGEIKEKLEKKLEDLPGYYSKRADAVDKLGLASTTVTETKNESATDSKGGKDGDEKKTSLTTTKEDKTTGSKTMAFHRVQHVYALDVQQYISLQSSLQFLISSYVAVLDNVYKNKAKLEQPKGSNGGSNFSSMY